MFNVGYFKPQPNEWVRHYASGSVRREGVGTNFFFLHHNTQIITVSLTSRDVPWVFNEVTNNFQAVTLQGQCTFRIAQPEKACALLNFAIDLHRRQYISDDPQKLPQRVTNIIQAETRVEIQKRTLEQTLVSTEAIGNAVLERLREDERLLELGVELLSLFIVAAGPTPEVGRALEAPYRESLLRQADEAVYARRAAAVEEERKIKENELGTDIALAEQRQGLIALEGENALQEAQNRGQAVEKEAEFTARAVEMQLNAYRNIDPRSLTALAMQELGKNAGRIGNLTVTSEILAALLDGRQPQGEEHVA